MNYKYFILLSFFIVFFQGIISSSANSLIQREILWNRAEVIEFETSSKDFALKVGIDTKWWSSLREIMQSVWGISWVTWVFQCPKDYAACGWKNHTVNERYVNWVKHSVYKSTGERVVFWWDSLYKAFIFQTGEINKDRESDIFEWLANHPLLLLEWEPMTDRYWEKWLIDEKMRKEGTRNFICSTKNSEKIFFWLVHKVNIDKLALVIKELGCYNAINLDAGYSTAMIHNWTYFEWPGREILDGVFIVAKNIDVNALEKTAEKISLSLNNALKKYRQEKRIEKLNTLILKIADYNNEIYNQKSENILENETHAVVWVRTQLSQKAIERVYLLSHLNANLYEKIKQYKKEIIERDSNPSFDLKF